MRIAAPLALVVICLAGCGGSDSSTTAPYVVGLREPLAIRVIEEAKLVPQVTRKSDSGVDAGLVYFQSPREGVEAEEGDVVRISVSTGP